MYIYQEFLPYAHSMNEYLQQSYSSHPNSNNKCRGTEDCLTRTQVFRSSNNYPHLWDHQVYHPILNTYTGWSKGLCAPDEQSPHNWWLEDGHHTIHSECGPCYTEHGILSSITNKMQRYTIYFIAVNVLHVSGSFSAHHQELKTVHTASGICQACLLIPHLVSYTWKNTLTMHGPMNVKLNTVFENTVRRVNKCLETGGGHFEHYL
jgi:hypothetical protein